MTAPTLLAFDTSASVCSVAIQQGEVITALHEVAPMQQAKQILPMIQSLLKTTGITLTEVDAIAYGCGPGSFTGLRIASSVAQGLGVASNRPIIPISSLSVMAKSAEMAHGHAHWLVALDARMGKVYWAAYQATEPGEMQLVGEESCCAPQAIPLSQALLETQDWYGVGEGWEKYRSILNTLPLQPKAIYAAEHPHAAAILALAKCRFEAGAWVTPGQAVPRYLYS